MCVFLDSLNIRIFVLPLQIKIFYTADSSQFSNERTCPRASVILLNVPSLLLHWNRCHGPKSLKSQHHIFTLPYLSSLLGVKGIIC